MEKDNMRDHMRPMPNQADAKIYESEQRENTKRHNFLYGGACSHTGGINDVWGARR